MYTGKLVFSKVIDRMPLHAFRRCVQRYEGERKVKGFICLDRFLCMAFAQLTYRESLRDIDACLRAQRSKLYHMSIRGGISRNTLANANKACDWRIYADFAQALIQIAPRLYVNQGFGVDLDNTAYALDASTIDLCRSLFPWAPACRTKAAVKLHTLLDLRGNIPTFIHISDGKLYDVNVLDFLIPEPGSFFFIPAKSNTRCRRLHSRLVDISTRLKCDQTIVLTGVHTPRYYPEKLRCIKYYDATSEKTFAFLTNNFSPPATTIADLYRCRWQVELFLKWIKQHLRIKAFFGISENAVKSQICIAVSVYVLVAIIKKRLKIDASLYPMLQILSLTVSERMRLDQVLSDAAYNPEGCDSGNQLNLFD